MKATHGRAEVPELVIDDREAVMDEVKAFLQPSAYLDAAPCGTIGMSSIDCARLILKALQHLTRHFFVVSGEDSDIAGNAILIQPFQNSPYTGIRTRIFVRCQEVFIHYPHPFHRADDRIAESSQGYRVGGSCALMYSGQIPGKVTAAATLATPENLGLQQSA